MTLPTYANLLEVDEIPTLEASLLASVSDAGVSSWATEAPQFGLLQGEAGMMRTFQEQRLILAYTASLRQILRLRPKLIDLGYSAADAATIVSSWVDASLDWYGADLVRIPAQRAEWLVGVKVTPAAAPLTIDGTTQGVLQADDGSFFELLQDAAVVLNAGSSYKGTVRVRARTAGIVGNVEAGTITTIRGPAGVSIDDTVTQVLALAGRDVETDEAVVARALAKWGTLGAAWSLDAFDYWIPTAAPTITKWRVRDDNPFGPGTTGAWLANDAGPATPEEVALVQAKMDARDVRPLGSGAFLALAAITAAGTLSVEIQTDGSNPTLLADATAAALALARAFPIGPAQLPDGRIVEVLMGAPLSSMVLPEIGTVPISPPLPGFGGAIAVVLSEPLESSIMTLEGEILVITPDITITVL